MTTVLTFEVPRWQQRAACTDDDAELFFPASDTPTLAQLAAVQICEHCPVKVECSVWADEQGITDGTWGGEMQAARRSRLRRNAVTARPPGMSYQAKVNAVRRLAHAGHPDSAISTATGIPHGTVTSIRRQHQIPAGTQVRRHRREAASAGLSRQAADRLAAGGAR